MDIGLFCNEGNRRKKKKQMFRTIKSTHSIKWKCLWLDCCFCLPFLWWSIIDRL